MLNKKLNVPIVSTMLLLATALIAIPINIANAQRQQELPASTSQSGINVDEEITNRGWASSSG